MLNGVSADFSGLEQGEAFSRHMVQDETNQAPGVKSFLEEMGLMDIEMEEKENTTSTAVTLNADEE